MIRRPPRATPTGTPFHYPPLFRAHRGVDLGLRPHAAATRLSYSARGFVSDCVVGLYSVMKSQILFARFSDRERPARKSEMRLARSEEHTSELQSLMRISYSVFSLKQTNHIYT